MVLLSGGQFPGTRGTLGPGTCLAQNLSLPPGVPEAGGTVFPRWKGLWTWEPEVREPGRTLLGLAQLVAVGGKTQGSGLA